MPAPVRRWRSGAAELARALDLGTGHLSLYQLTIEPGTRFATDVRQGAFAPLDDDPAADLFALTREMTAAAGLPAYEISNHARPGEESRHNLDLLALPGLRRGRTGRARAARRDGDGAAQEAGELARRGRRARPRHCRGASPRQPRAGRPRRC